ncbi:uncharacterized protein LOC129816552 [Salvelinus fontinalis]|uniref:uncharacterized protein LOC129816552 n=1 Tax=Salvelinus fontinalis TaxID=8038 RepID=UPI0024854D6F|nr:uncharacterized protein LOC129816552 [Salvelinus fontinalis]
MDISQDSQTFTQILRDITELEPAVGSPEQIAYIPTPTLNCTEIHPRTGAIGSLHGFCEGYAYETIVPYSQDVFTHKPQTEPLNGLSTPLTQDRWTPPIKHQRTIRAQIHRSASPEQYYWEGIHETALQGQGSQATDQADAIIRVAQRHVPEFLELLQNSPLQKSRDSSPAYKDLQEATHLDPEEAPKTPVTRTAKPDDFKVLNDISEVDDLMFCEVANLIEAANSGGAKASCEIDQAVLFKAFTQGLKSRKALLQRRMGILFEHQYNQDVSFWRRELPRMLNNSRVKTSKYLR